MKFKWDKRERIPWVADKNNSYFLLLPASLREIEFTIC